VGVRPLPLQGLDEALDLAVPARRVGRGEDLARSVALERSAYEIVFYEDDGGAKQCLDWIKNDLSPSQRRAIGMAMFEVLQRQGTNVVSVKSWGRQLGGGVIEFRLDRTVKTNGAKEQMCLRVFFHGFGDKKLLCLHGYDKGSGPGPRRQQREIAEAKRRLRHWQQRQKRAPSEAKPGSGRAQTKRRPAKGNRRASRGRGRKR
jgi:phage-related protein